MSHPLISIFGPPQSGKQTLLSAIVKQNINTPYPITCFLNNFKFTITTVKTITAKNKNDILFQMIDSSKIADIHILTIDGTVGIEVDTLEYIALIQAHSPSNIVIVITKSDKNIKDIKNTIKKHLGKVKTFIYIKKIYSKNKTLSEIEENKNINNNSITNLIRYLSNIKIVNTVLNSTPHILVDKIIDNKLYGYLRGGIIKKDQIVNINNNIISSYKTYNTKIKKVKDPLPQSKKKLENKYKVYIPYTEMEDGVYIKVKKNNEENENNLNVKENNNLNIKKDENDLFLFDNVAFKNEKKIYKEKEEIKEEIKAEVEEEIEDKIDIENNYEILKEKMKQKIKNINYSDSEEENLSEEIEKEEESTAKIEEENHLNNYFYPGEYLEVEISENFIFSKFLFLFFVNGLNINSSVNADEKKDIILLSGKITKHKFYKGYIESNDAYIISLGLYKYQTTPIFYSYDGVRNRVIKILPELDYVGISLYSPLVNPSTPLSLIRSTSNFRVCAYGSITGSSIELLKPLRLIGNVQKIHHNSAVISNMFTSDMEVLRARNTRIKTTSGIRGIIKNPIDKNGLFRATFEGPITKNDIITYRTYVENKPHKIYKEITDKILRSRKELFIIKDAKKDNKIDNKINNKIDNKTKILNKVETKNIILNKYDKKIERLEKKLTLDKRKIIKEKILPDFLEEEEEESSSEDKIYNEKKTENKVEETKKEIKKLGIIKSIKNKKHKKKKRLRI